MSNQEYTKEELERGESDVSIFITNYTLLFAIILIFIVIIGMIRLTIK